MTKKDIQKNFDLANYFSLYALKHPEVVEGVGRRASIVTINPSDKRQEKTALELACCVLAEERRTSSRQGRLLLGEQVAKDIFYSLPELETLVGIEDHSLHECLGLLTTRFPNGFEGQAALCQ